MEEEFFFEKKMTKENPTKITEENPSKYPDCLCKFAENVMGPNDLKMEANPKQNRAIPWVDGLWGDYCTTSEDGKKVTFELQQGNLIDYGVNGCDPIKMVSFACLYYQELNRKIPNRETSQIVTKLEEALCHNVVRAVKRRKLWTQEK